MFYQRLLWLEKLDVYKRQVYADAAGNAICVKRSRIELLKAYIKMLKVFRLIDLHYDKVCEEYRKNHSKLESKDFWSNYLELKDCLLYTSMLAILGATMLSTVFQAFGFSLLYLQVPRSYYFFYFILLSKMCIRDR